MHLINSFLNIVFNPLQIGIGFLKEKKCSQFFLHFWVQIQIERNVFWVKLLEKRTCEQAQCTAVRKTFQFDSYNWFPSFVCSTETISLIGRVHTSHPSSTEPNLTVYRQPGSMPVDVGRTAGERARTAAGPRRCNPLAERGPAVALLSRRNNQLRERPLDTTRPKKGRVQSNRARNIHVTANVGCSPFGYRTVSK